MIEPPDLESVSPSTLSVVIPVLDDNDALKRLLLQLDNYDIEIVVVDGGSRKPLDELVQSFNARLVYSEPGRAKQMNRGAEAARGDFYLFLHADSTVPKFFDSLIVGGLRGRQFKWGWFDVRLSGMNPMFRMIEWMMNVRSSLTGICTGDMGIFVHSKVFKAYGGFPEIPIMEDIAFSKMMDTKPYVIRHKIGTSSRRWEQNGILKTILLMWSLRLRYFFGADPEDLVKRYYG